MATHWMSIYTTQKTQCVHPLAGHIYHTEDPMCPSIGWPYIPHRRPNVSIHWPTHIYHTEDPMCPSIGWPYIPHRRPNVSIHWPTHIYHTEDPTCPSIGRPIYTTQKTQCVHPLADPYIPHRRPNVSIHWPTHIYHTEDPMCPSIGRPIYTTQKTQCVHPLADPYIPHRRPNVSIHWPTHIYHTEDPMCPSIGRPIYTTQKTQRVHPLAGPYIPHRRPNVSIHWLAHTNHTEAQNAISCTINFVLRCFNPYWELAQDCNFNVLAMELKHYSLNQGTSHCKQERLKRQNTLSCLDQYAAQNSKYARPQSHHNPQTKRFSSSSTLNMIPPWNIHTVKQSMPRSCSNGCSLNWLTPSEFSQLIN